MLSVFAREISFVDGEGDKVKSNQIFLDGYICKTPIYRRTPLGREISDMLLAVNRPYGKSDYIPCICWGRNARFTSGFEVGGHVQIWGRIQSRDVYKRQILMDASGSQRDRQGQVALQAYIISEALSCNQVPHRIMSFCSFWDYTVLQRFREYDAPRSENRKILDYTTSANNRDGLAIRAAGDGLLARPEEGKILIVLSDGRPNDIIVNRPNSHNPQPYYGEYAVKDTAYEIRKLRSQGVYVLGVFARCV